MSSLSSMCDEFWGIRFRKPWDSCVARLECFCSVCRYFHRPISADHGNCHGPKRRRSSRSCSHVLDTREACKTLGGK